MSKRNQEQRKTRIELSPDLVRVTNEEILRDLLYPAPAHVNGRRVQARR